MICTLCTGTTTAWCHGGVTSQINGRGRDNAGLEGLESGKDKQLTLHGVLFIIKYFQLVVKCDELGIHILGQVLQDILVATLGISLENNDPTWPFCKLSQ